jgi:hypothetical protein
MIWLALVLSGALLATRAGADEDEAKAARKDILDVAKALEGGKGVVGKVAAIRKKYEDLEHLMKAYKPREKGGLGIGPPGAGDGIEYKIYNLGKRKLSAAALAKEKNDLIKMAYLNLAMIEIARPFAPKVPNPLNGRGAKEWRQRLDSMKEASRALLDAVKKNDPEALKGAAARIQTSCLKCHDDVRR